MPVPYDSRHTVFQSTLPLRGATPDSWSRPHAPHISIHAPLAGSDKPIQWIALWRSNFNPRSPCGERPCGNSFCQFTDHFNPRSPCGERQCDAVIVGQRFDFNPRSPCGERRPDSWSRPHAPHISIHAPLAGSDGRQRQRRGCRIIFQSTLPLRGATCGLVHTGDNRIFQSTLPLRGATCVSFVRQ